MRRLKAVLLAVMILVMAVSFVACSVAGNGDTEGKGSDIEGGATNGTPVTGSEGENGTLTPPENGKTSILVVYFSCSGTTKGWAQTLQAKLSADIYEIVPAIPYTSADLNYSNSSSRSSVEQKNSAARPDINGGVENIARYEVVYLGYPIWFGQAPKIIYTFLESYDFTGVTIIPFCTSASSPMGSSGTNLHGSAPDAIWKSGCRVSSSSNVDALANEITG